MNDLTGILYIVATPIGNLQDITQRALETFSQVDLIAAEDTRHSGLLLSHYGIKKPFFALHDHNEQEKAHVLVEKLKQGTNIALISDAGTPLISDPGFHLVRQCREAGIKVVPLPGACAAITALCASGIASDRFCFEGFLPQKKGRQTHLLALQNETRTMVFYESPYRLLKTLQQFAEVFGDERQVSVAREISKVYEEHVRGTLRDAIEHFTEKDPRGEFVIVVAGANIKKEKEKKLKLEE